MQFEGLSPFSQAYRDQIMRLAARVDDLINLARLSIDQGDRTGLTRVFPAAILESQKFPEGAYSQMQSGLVLAGDQWFYRFQECTIRLPQSNGAIAFAPGSGGATSFSGGEYGQPNSALEPGGFFKLVEGGREGWAINGLEAGNVKNGAFYGTGNAYSQGLASVEVLPVGRMGAVIPVVQMLEIDIGSDVEIPGGMSDETWALLLGKFSTQYFFSAPNPIKPSCAPPPRGADRGDGGLMLF